MSDDLGDIVGGYTPTDFSPVLARFTGAGNLVKDAGWVWYQKQGSYWTKGEAWLIEAVTTSTVQKRGRYRARLTLPQANVITDAFGRTSVDSWGSADVGGAYSLTGTAADFDVNSGVGKVLINASDGKAASLASVSARDLQGLYTVSLDKVPTGANVELHLALRRLNNSNLYRARLLFQPGGTVTISIERVLAGVTTTLGSAVTVTTTYSAGARILVRFEADGASPTNLRVRAWLFGSSEPSTWAVETTDSSAALQVAGNVYVGGASGAISNAPILASFDDFSVVRSSTAYALDSDFIAVGTQQLYTAAILDYLDWTSGNSTVQLREYDSSKVFIQSQDLTVSADDVEWPTVEVVRFAATGATPPLDVDIDAELHANTRFVKLRLLGTSGVTGDWIVPALAVLDGPQPQLTSSPEASSEALVQIDAGGVLIDGGGLRVENAGAVVIIDGTSNMFKIAASGTFSHLQGANSNGSGSVTLSGYSDLGLLLASVGYGPAATDSHFTSVLIDADGGSPGDETAGFVAATSGGSPTVRISKHAFFATVGAVLSGSDALISLYVSNQTPNPETRYARYYLLKESAI